MASWWQSSKDVDAVSLPCLEPAVSILLKARISVQHLNLLCAEPTRITDKWATVECDASLAAAETEGGASMVSGLPPSAGLTLDGRTDALNVVVLSLAGNELLRKGFPPGTSVAKLCTLLEQAAGLGSKARILLGDCILDDADFLGSIDLEDQSLQAVFEMDHSVGSLLSNRISDEVSDTFMTVHESTWPRQFAQRRQESAGNGIVYTNGQMRQEMRDFVKSLLRGRELVIMGRGGQLRICTCTLDRRIQSLRIGVYGQVRTVMLSSIAEVLEGREADATDAIATPLDECCTTLLLDCGESITFRSRSVGDRKSFSRCLKVMANLM